jgi:hypothetical protein
MSIAMTQQDLERLLRESEQIASDWNAYIQFCQNRDAILRDFLADQGSN